MWVCLRSWTYLRSIRDIAAPSSECVRSRWEPTANICPPRPSCCPPRPWTWSSSCCPPPSWLCALQYATVYRGMVMLWLYRRRHDMVAAIMPQSSKPFVLLARYNELRPKLRIWGASLGRKSVNWAEDGLASVLGLSTGRHLISTPVGLISCWPQCCTLIGWAVGQLRSDWLSRSGARAAVRVGG